MAQACALDGYSSASAFESVYAAAKANCEAVYEFTSRPGRQTIQQVSGAVEQHIRADVVAQLLSTRLSASMVLSVPAQYASQAQYAALSSRTLVWHVRSRSGARCKFYRP